MDIKFQDHQLVYAGLNKQIELLHHRCAEHKAAIANQRDLIVSLEDKQREEAERAFRVYEAYEDRVKFHCDRAAALEKEIEAVRAAALAEIKLLKKQCKRRR